LTSFFAKPKTREDRFITAGVAPARPPGQQHEKPMME
jgi:hypothetical protein